MSQMFCVRLSPETARNLESVAAATERPKAFLIRKALEAYLDECADYQVALDRLRDKNDPVISGKELGRRLGVSG